MPLPKDSSGAGEGGLDPTEFIAGGATKCNKGVPESMGEEAGTPLTSPDGSSTGDNESCVGEGARISETRLTGESIEEEGGMSSKD